MIVRYSYRINGNWCGPYDADRLDFLKLWKRIYSEVSICYVSDLKTGKTWAYCRDIDNHWSQAKERGELPDNVKVRLGYILAEVE